MTKFHWGNILQEPGYGIIFHQDYSENISCSPKYEPQDTHFSSKQTSLHCTVVHNEGKDTRYACHISEDKGHDFAFTKHVTIDLIERYSDEVMSSPVLRIKSDNCSIQYCCLWVFRVYSELAKELDKPVILYYGINGHGRGLVDAMSGFSVKTPLRNSIVKDDYFPETEQELLEFLNKIHSQDDKKYFKYIPRADIKETRSNKANGYPINGCQKSKNDSTVSR